MRNTVAIPEKALRELKNLLIQSETAKKTADLYLNAIVNSIVDAGPEANVTLDLNGGQFIIEEKEDDKQT